MVICDLKEVKNDLYEENVYGLDCKFFNGLLWWNYAKICLLFYEYFFYVDYFLFFLGYMLLLYFIYIFYL